MFSSSKLFYLSWLYDVFIINGAMFWCSSEEIKTVIVVFAAFGRCDPGSGSSRYGHERNIGPVRQGLPPTGQEEEI